jgi:putative GTP pyrophosphokinase
MGSALALREGSSALVPDTPTNKGKLISELKEMTADLSVLNTLQIYGQAINVAREGAEKKNDHYFLLKLEPRNGQMTITGFPRKSLEEASAKYLEVEREISGTPGSEAVLVSVDSLGVLQRAYPNYFLDTHQELQRVIK